MAIEDLSGVGGTGASGIIGGAGGGGFIVLNDVIVAEKVEYLTILAGDLVSKVKSVLGNIDTASKVKVSIMKGPTLDYGIDFIADSALNEIQWGGLGIDGILAAGDKLRINYFNP